MASEDCVPSSIRLCDQGDPHCPRNYGEPCQRGCDDGLLTAGMIDAASSLSVVVSLLHERLVTAHRLLSEVVEAVHDQGTLHPVDNEELLDEIRNELLNKIDASSG